MGNCLRLERKTFEGLECNHGYIQTIDFAEGNEREEVE
jgi:hypothetical protein